MTDKDDNYGKDEHAVPTPPPPIARFNIGTIKKDVVRHLKHLQNTQTYEKNTWLKECKQLLSRLMESKPEKYNKQYFYSIHSNITPVVQDGPQCGLVALCMAGDMMGLPIEIDIVYQKARSMGITLQGEMFSADAMLNLGKTLFSCDGQIVQGNTITKEIVIKSVINSNPILVPYDKDRNHEPCLKQGKRAHWAVISGVVFQAPTILQFTSTNFEIQKDCEITSLYHLSTNSIQGKNLINFEYITGNIYVYANQGKSLRTHLWLLEDLMRSNSQLTVIDPKVVENKQDYVIPDDGIESSLSNKAVILYKL